VREFAQHIGLRLGEERDTVPGQPIAWPKNQDERSSTDTADHPNRWGSSRHQITVRPALPVGSCRPTLYVRLWVCRAGDGSAHGLRDGRRRPPSRRLPIVAYTGLQRIEGVRRRTTRWRVGLVGEPRGDRTDTRSRGDKTRARLRHPSVTTGRTRCRPPPKSLESRVFR
jgi:hypothetical protein